MESPGSSDPGLRPRRPIVFRASNTFARVVLWLLRARITVEDVANVPDRPGVILASNHLSVLDPVLLTLAIEDRTKRRIRYMAKAEAMAWPGFGRLLTGYGGFAVRRGRPDLEAYRTAEEVVRGGDWLGLAPEGTRSRTGALIEPKAGVALFAIRTGAPILPTGIWGTEHLWPVGARLPRFGQAVTIRFGELYYPRVIRPGNESVADDAVPATAEPMEPSGGTAGELVKRGQKTGAEPATRRQRIDATTEDLMRRIAALLPPPYRGRFG